MSRLHATALYLAFVLTLASCTGGNQDAENAAATESTADFQTVKTPPAVSRAASEDQTAGASASPVRTEPRPEAATPSQPAGAGAGRSDIAEASPAEEPEIEIVPQTEAPEEPEPPRTTLAGAWEFILCDFGVDTVGLLINVDTGEETMTAAIEDETRMFPGWSIQSVEMTETSAHIEFNTGEGRAIDFRGELHEDGIVRGNITYGQEGMDLVRWLPSQRDSLDPTDGRISSENVDLMNGFQPSGEDALAEIQEKARELGQSALAYELYRRLNSVIRSQRPDEQEYSKLPDEYLAAARLWGERVVTRAQLDVAYTMAICGYSPAAAESHLKRATEQLGEDVTPPLQTRLTIAGGLILLHSDDSADQHSGVELLNGVRAADPYNADVVRGLAAYREQNGEPEEALSLYSELVALPTGAGDMSPVVRLWDELGRDPSGIETHLNEVYKSRVHQFADPSSDAPRASGNQRVVLGELFTGASCPPCVAADVATGGLEITYPMSDLIMLRYHEHIPGPDPLAIADGEQRGIEYYQIQGTPSLFLNGQPVTTVVSIYGPIFNAPTGYADLRGVVDPLLSESTELTIALVATATADGESIRIQAAVHGADEIPESWRLRLCLTEDEIMHPANNGVRLHEMVVRAMPGGTDGIAPAEGTLDFEDSLSLEQVRQEIHDYLEQVRSQLKERMGRDPNLPDPPLDMRQLHVVAFVQDDATQEILQAAAVPVSGLPDAVDGDPANDN